MDLSRERAGDGVEGAGGADDGGVEDSPREFVNENFDFEARADGAEVGLRDVSEDAQRGDGGDTKEFPAAGIGGD